jgi:hypothetical protein
VAKPIRIANCSGFAGDRVEAIREILDGGPVDVIIGDYLAEMTIATMAARRLADRGEGYSEDLIDQLEGCLGEILERGIKVVVNAGGFDSAGLVERIRGLSEGREAKIAYLEGDDVLARLDRGDTSRPAPAPTSAPGASSRRSRAAPTSSSARGSPMPRSSSVPPPGTTDGGVKIGIDSPRRWSPGT